MSIWNEMSIKIITFLLKESKWHEQNNNNNKLRNERKKQIEATYKCKRIKETSKR